MTDDTPAAGDTRTTAEFEVGGGDDAVTVRKRVSKGERLEIDTGTESVTLDALLLEGLSWQPDRAALGDRLDATDVIATDPVPEAGGEPVADAPEISISNEYSHVVVRKVETEAGHGLEIETPNRGSALTLGVTTLRVVAAVEDTFVFSTWFETPFGPEDTPVEGPL